MKTTILLFAFALSFLINQPFTYAEKGVMEVTDGVKGVRGELATIDLGAKSISIIPEGSVDRETLINVIVPADSEFSGFSELTELRVGDEVSVEAHENVESKLLEARSIALVKVKLRDTAL